MTLAVALKATGNQILGRVASATPEFQPSLRDEVLFWPAVALRATAKFI